MVNERLLRSRSMREPAGKRVSDSFVCTFVVGIGIETNHALIFMRIVVSCDDGRLNRRKKCGLFCLLSGLCADLLLFHFAESNRNEKCRRSAS